MSAPPPIRFGRYELLERLGSGGMAVVYRALYTAAPGVTKPMVIKRVLGSYAEDPAFVQMFLNEARISVGLSHGNIVQVFDFGQVDGEYFLAMELVEGHPLGRVLKAARARGQGSLPAPLAVGITLEMCRGLHHAHARLDERGKPLGVVHRDLSPDNVLLSYEGEVKLTDFGIAKARLKGRPETEVGVVKGKYLYFSPEQARGEVLDARSDVYTVGTVLYQMLCGQRPVESTSEFEVMRRISQGELTPALSLNPTLDTDLQGILQLALATSKEQRFRSAEALQQALSDWMGAHAPRFPANARKLFMGWLFQEELTALKRPPQLPADFPAQLQSWRGGAASPPPAPGPRALTPLSPPRASPMGRPALAPASPAAPAAVASPLSSRLRRPAVVAGVLGALAVGTLGLVGMAVSSRPPPSPAPLPGSASAATAEAEPRPPAPGAEAQPAPPVEPAAGLAPHEAPSDEEPSPEEQAQAAFENGLFWASRGNDDRALGWFQQCLEQDSDSAPCHLELGRLYARRGAVRDAVRHFTHHLSLEREGPTVEEARRYLELYAGAHTP